MSILIVIYSFTISGAETMENRKHIVLLGASVGRDWNIESLPERLIKNSSISENLRNLAAIFSFEFVGEYQFDKTKALQKILTREEKKPNAIFIKECAAYFPGDLLRYQKLMEMWIKQCIDSNVIPIPTTVVPVIRPSLSDLNLRLKDAVKFAIGKPTLSSRLDGLLKYNDWIRSHAQKERLSLLDLEMALRVNEMDRSLKKEFHSGDGLHLNQKAYTILDQIVYPALGKAFKIEKIQK